MKHLALPALAAATLLSACTTTATQSPDGILSELPEGVAEIADPAQDLSVVRIDPVDGCYWHQWRGPVETTFLPLRTREGRPICARLPEEETETTG